jgi:selenocysteine lyase/cysteine desulfurase
MVHWGGLVMLGRRDFIQRAAVATALFGIPKAQAQEAFGRGPDVLPPLKLMETDPDRYWSELRRQWILASDRINLNCGQIGCTPLPVLRAMIDHLLYAESYREPERGAWGYEEVPRAREVRDALASFLHCQRDELALTRNATEGNNIVCNGLDLKAGDEVLLTDQEHVGGKCPWEQKAARYGIKLNVVKLPQPPASADEIVKLFEKALTPKTRVILFSHITAPTGLILPAKAICKLARSRDVLTHIDGAHAIGQIPLDLHDLGCDFYATSPHKWLMAPKGTGLLYVRAAHLDRLWVTTASGEWRNYKLKALRFSNLGTSNLTILVGLKAALDFFRAIGPQFIYARIHEQARKVRDRLKDYPQVHVINASEDEFYGGMVSFRPAKGNLDGVVKACAARRIRIGNDTGAIRISTHIHTQQTELNSFFDAVELGLRKGG